MKIVTVAQMRALEHAAVDAGATWAGLMEQAGWGVAQVALRLLGDPRGRAVLMLIGSGNNGGDGLVIARHLHDAGARVVLFIWQRRDPQADANWLRCREREISEFDAAQDAGQDELRRLLATTELFIDALLGSGMNRPVRGDLAALIHTVNAERMRCQFTVLAVDVPTGLDADTGAIQGAALRADHTVATGALKRGMLLLPGCDLVGSLHVADIGLSSHQLEACMSEQITADVARQLLPARPNDSHKGTYGKLMVVAGSLHYPGAATLATAAGLRVGAGLVTLATSRSVVGAPGRLPEVTLRPLPEEGWGVLGEEAASELLKHIEGYTALIVGPGLGHEEPTKLFLTRLFDLHEQKQRGRIGFQIGAAPEKPAAQRPALPSAVIDADGLNLLAEVESWWEHVQPLTLVLTPHPGEMKRLLKADELPGDPIAAAEAAAKQWKQIVVLKGATTVVAHPEGRAAVYSGGNPALATAGTGDVLAGTIGGLLAQGLTPYDAAVCGVYLHAKAGQIVRDELGDAGTIASDLLARLPLAIKSLR